MNHLDFDTLLLAMMADDRAVLASKSAEYAEPGDKLHNFNEACALIPPTPDPTPLFTAWVFLVKHLQSLKDLVRRHDAGQDIPPDLWAEKLGDARRYLHIMQAQLAAREDRRKP